jgi:hypothetical protein
MLHRSKLLALLVGEQIADDRLVEATVENLEAPHGEKRYVPENDVVGLEAFEDVRLSVYLLEHHHRRLQDAEDSRVDKRLVTADIDLERDGDA